MGADDVAAAHPAPARRGRGRLRSWVLPLLGLMPFGAGLALWLRTLPTTIDSAVQLTRVEFGWPLPWTVQDLTRYAPQRYPASMDYIGGKYVVDPPPSTENWWLFAADAGILGACAFLVLALVVRLLRPVLLGRGLRGGRGSGGADAGAGADSGVGAGGVKPGVGPGVGPGAGPGRADQT